MATREIAHVIKFPAPILVPISSAAVLTSTAIDTQGWQGIAIAFIYGAWTAGNFLPSLTECATLAGTYTAVDPTTIEWWVNGVSQGLGNAPTVLSATLQNSVIVASYTGNLRFLKGVSTSSNTPTAMIVGMLAVQGWPRESI